MTTLAGIAWGLAVTLLVALIHLCLSSTIRR